MPNATITREVAVEAVISCCAELNDQMGAGIKLEGGALTPLFGGDGPLDSLGLVNLTVAVEQELAKRITGPVPPLSEAAQMGNASIFATIGSLASYIENCYNPR